jgi:hypothetical protein
MALNGNRGKQKPDAGRFQRPFEIVMARRTALV